MTAGLLPQPLERDRFLVLDDRIIAEAMNARLAVGQAVKHPGNPLFVADKPWEPWIGNGYFSLFFDDDWGLYRCWYEPFVVDKAYETVPPEKRGQIDRQSSYRELRRSDPSLNLRYINLCYAESEDGLSWNKPEMDIVRWKGRQSNMVMENEHGAGVFRDERDPDPARRYKAFMRNDASSGKEMSVAFSPDGLHWSEPVPCIGMSAKGDTHNNALWSPDLGCYVGITREWDGVRIVARTESEDFLHWSATEEIFRGSDPNLQLYSMPVLRYAGVYLGLPAIFNIETDRVHTELAWSPDTVHWQRIDEGIPLIPNGEREGSCDWGCVYAADAPVILEDEIRLYYFGDQGLHSNWRGPLMGLCLSTLGPDGFAGYEQAAKNSPAVIVTRPVLCDERPLRITAQGGEVRVTAKTAGREALVSEPVRGSAIEREVRFTGSDPACLRGRPVSFRFELHSARLYAFSFTSTRMILKQ